ncbi:MAG TPA: MarR family winged helix-turn-helix transcriptional regulator [Candidatus Acidoferrum sp.]|nr:MarR family winged helix-turn-helix transcriptional regulator [Candidatus Acidoferrum sp.]
MKESVSAEAVSAWARLIRVEQALLQKVEQDLKDADLPPLDWYDVLLELDRAADGRLRHRDLHPRLLLAKYNLSRLIDRLEAAGLVRREPSADDARGADIAITAKGRELRRRMWPIYAAAIDRHFASRLSERHIGQLDRILQALC